MTEIATDPTGTKKVTMVLREDYDDVFYYIDGKFITRESQDGAEEILRMLGADYLDETDGDADPFADRVPSALLAEAGE